MTEPIKAPDPIQTVIANRIVNFRFGACDQGFEDRPVEAAGEHEICAIVENDDGTVSIRSPNGLQWLSIQPDGTWEGRDAATPPGLYEKFTRVGNVLTECHKEGYTRPPVTLSAPAD